ETAAHAAALVAAAAGRAGDRVGLASFADAVRTALPPARGAAHGWRLVRAIAEESAHPAGATALAAAAAWALARARRRALVVLLSDFRDAAFARAMAGGGGSPLAALASRHDVVSVLVEDPRERALLAAGGLRLVDPEGGGAPRVLGTSARRRARYAAAAEARRAALVHRLRSEGADVLPLSTASDPLRALVRFFRARADRRRGAWRGAGGGARSRRAARGGVPTRSRRAARGGVPARSRRSPARGDTTLRRRARPPRSRRRSRSPSPARPAPAAGPAPSRRPRPRPPTRAGRPRH